MITTSNARVFHFLSFVVLFFAFTASAFAQNGGVAGKIRGANGEAISNAAIIVRSEGRDVKSGTSDAKGNFSLTGLPRGKV